MVIHYFLVHAIAVDEVSLRLSFPSLGALTNIVIRHAV